MLLSNQITNLKQWIYCAFKDAFAIEIFFSFAIVALVFCNMRSHFPPTNIFLIKITITCNYLLYVAFNITLPVSNINACDIIQNRQLLNASIKFKCSKRTKFFNWQFTKSKVNSWKRIEWQSNILDWNEIFIQRIWYAWCTLHKYIALISVFVVLQILHINCV